MKKNVSAFLKKMENKFMLNQQKTTKKKDREKRTSPQTNQSKKD